MPARAAATAAFVGAARPLLARCGVPWQDDLERAVTCYLARELGIPPQTGS